MNTASEQAQHWIRCLPHATQPQRQAFARWLKASPGHVQSYLQMLAVEREFQGFDAAHEIDVDGLIARARSNVVPLERHRRMIRRMPMRWRVVAAIAAAIASMAWVVCALVWKDHDLQEFTTHTGQQEQFKLSDGSLVNLNADTSVRARVTRDRRDIYLITGEALFDIKHDPGRPLHVHVDGVTIEDVGTQFDVYKRAGATRISVIEGEVRVLQEPPSVALSVLAPLLDRHTSPEPGYVPLTKPIPILAGNTASVTARGREIRKTSLDLQQATAWRQRLLVFHGSSLREIAAEFNHFNTEPKIRVAGDAIGNRTFSGIFRADDPKSFIAFLQQETDLTVDTEGSDLRIAGR